MRLNFNRRRLAIRLPLAWAGLGLAALSLAGCGPHAATGGAGQASAPGKVLRVGYQKYGALPILKARGDLDKDLAGRGYTVKWTQFPGGPQLLEALNAGSIDVGEVGETPPIFAQAAGTPLVYLGNGAPAPAGEAILVAKDSPIKTLTDLKGKHVVLNKGSNVHYLLVQVLNKAGLKYSDIQVSYLPPSDARAAFEQGSADAWVIWDPFFASAQHDLNARVLLDGTGLVANRQFYLSSQDFLAQHPDLAHLLIQDLTKTDIWTGAHPHDVAVLLAPQLGLDLATTETVVRRRPYGIQAVTPEVVAYQQNIADVFFQLGLLPKKIAVKDAQWTPGVKQAAR